MATMLEKIDKFLFGPLSHNWCLWFYVFTIYFFAALVFVTLRLIFSLFTNKLSIELFAVYAIIFGMYFVQYIEKRLLHSMCKASI